MHKLEGWAGLNTRFSWVGGENMHKLEGGLDTRCTGQWRKPCMDFSSFRPFAQSLKLLAYHQKRTRFPSFGIIG
jgi:hypothetical protein